MGELCVNSAAVNLILNYPFWCELYYSVKVIEVTDPAEQRRIWRGATPTLATDGRKLYVNPVYWNTLEFKYRVSALAHESCHKMLHHPTRGRKHVEPYRNKAMDIIVNGLLKQNGFAIHPGWIQPVPKYDGWAYESIYYDLIEADKKPEPPPSEDQDTPEPQQGQGDGKDEADEGDSAPGEDEELTEDDLEEAAQGEPEEDDDGETQEGDVGGDEEGEEETESSDGAGDEEGEEEGEGDGEAPGNGEGDVPIEEIDGMWADVLPFEGTDEQAEAFEEKVEAQVQQALENAKAMGSVPKGVEGQVAQVNAPPKETWKDHLYRFFQSLRQGEYDWKRIDRRMAMHHRVIAPTQFTEQLGTTVIFRDASGSCMSPYQQAEFTSNINSILSDVRPSKVIVADFEMGVTQWSEVEPGELEFTRRPLGGGGTSFRELFTWLDEQGIVPEVVIILTDMYGSFPTEVPDYPVIWASTSQGVGAPFGEVIEIK